jgi:hypothetical protein
MGIPIFDDIGKLINEHGSATILKERIFLAADQYAILERKVHDLEAKMNALEHENARLQLDIQKCEEEKEGCQAQIDQTRTIPLNKNHEAVLIAVASCSGRDVSAISKYCVLSVSEVSEKLNYLESASLVHQKRGGIKNPTPGGFPLAVQVWYLSEKGHQCISANNLTDRIS